MIEGYLKIQPNGRYAIEGKKDCYELTCGESVEVRIDGSWVAMRLEHDGVEYYLLGERLSFYPRKVYVRYS